MDDGLILRIDPFRFQVKTLLSAQGAAVLAQKHYVVLKDLDPLAIAVQTMVVTGMGGLSGPGQAEEEHPIAFERAILLPGRQELGAGVDRQHAFLPGFPHGHAQEAHLHLADVVAAQHHG